MFLAIEASGYSKLNSDQINRRHQHADYPGTGIASPDKNRCSKSRLSPLALQTQHYSLEGTRPRTGTVYDRPMRLN